MKLDGVGCEDLRLEAMRMILESSRSDEELRLKTEAVGEELQAIDRALDTELDVGKGSYLGIVDKAELENRKKRLMEKARLLEEERDLLQPIRAALAVEERKETEQAEKEALSPAQCETSTHINNVDNHDNGSRSTATLSTLEPSVQAVVQQKQPLTSSTPSQYRFSPPGATDGGISEFLKANAAVGTPSWTSRNARDGND